MKRKLLLLLAGLAMSLPAAAHVKWFSMMANCASTPLTTLAVMSCPLFAAVAMAAFVAMFAVSSVDGRVSRGHNAASRWAAWLDRGAGEWIVPVLRIGVAGYFVAIVVFFHGAPIILTIDLKTDAAWVPALQLAIAVAALHRRSASLAALGIAILFAYAVHCYGLFHMLDYQFFPGLAAFLVMTSSGAARGRLAALGVLRLAIGFSLLWCGVEKWLYPDWTRELLRTDLHVLLKTGLPAALIVMGAGFVEFGLAFLLVFGRLASQAAAAILLLLMVAAIPVVGMLDLIGHLPIIVVLAILAITRNPIGRSATAPAKQSSADTDIAISFMVAVPGSIAAYYLGHELAYGALARVSRTEWIFAGALLVLLAVHIVRIAPDILKQVARSTAAMHATVAP